MKRIALSALLIAAAAMLSFSLIGCGGSSDNAGSTPEPSAPAVDASNIESLLAEQDLYASGFTVQNDYDEYPTMLSACIHIGSIVNNSENAFKSATIMAVTYNDEGWPVSWSYLGSYDNDQELHLNIADLNLSPGETFTLPTGFWSNNGTPNDSTSIRVIVAFATMLDGTEWTNPLLEDWKAIYEGQMLPN